MTVAHEKNDNFFWQRVAEKYACNSEADLEGSKHQ